MATPPRPRDHLPSPGRGVLWLLLGAALAWLGSFAASHGEGTLARLAAGLAAQGLFACAALGGAALAGPSVLPEGLRLGRSRLRAGETALLVLGFVSLSLLVGTAILWSGLREGSALGEIDRTARAARTAPAIFALALLSLALVPAFCEELLCRGLIQQSARTALGPRAAIVISALAFGLLHLDAVQGTGAVALGLYLAAATELAASLRPAMLCHLVNNLLGMLAPELAALEPPSLAAAGAAALGLLGLSGAALAVPRRRLARIPGGSA